jgi:hypothetical protein
MPSHDDHRPVDPDRPVLAPRVIRCTCQRSGSPLGLGWHARPTPGAVELVAVSDCSTSTRPYWGRAWNRRGLDHFGTQLAIIIITSVLC